jgi:hypothetical protein
MLMHHLHMCRHVTPWPHMKKETDSRWVLSIGRHARDRIFFPSQECAVAIHIFDSGRPLGRPEFV